MSEELQKPVVVASPFTEREEAALQLHLQLFQQHKEAALAPSLQAEMFQAFLHGDDLPTLVRRHPGIRLGQVVRAAKEGNWHDLRAEYRDQLLRSVIPRVQQVQSEAILFSADLMAVAHKMHGGKLRKYLETGDEKDLGDFHIKTLDGYKKNSEIFLKMTGQDGGKRKPVEDPPPPPKDVPQPQVLPPTPSLPRKPLDVKTADSFLAALDGEEDEP